jgi:hypothetical protein
MAYSIMSLDDLIPLHHGLYAGRSMEDKYELNQIVYKMKFHNRSMDHLSNCNLSMPVDNINNVPYIGDKKFKRCSR